MANSQLVNHKQLQTSDVSVVEYANLLSFWYLGQYTLVLKSCKLFLLFLLTHLP